MDWITDQIAIGDALDAVNFARQFDSILWLLSGCCEERTDIDGYCVPLHDGPLESATSCLNPNQETDEIDNERTAQAFFTRKTELIRWYWMSWLVFHRVIQNWKK